MHVVQQPSLYTPSILRYAVHTADYTVVQTLAYNVNSCLYAYRQDFTGGGIHAFVPKGKILRQACH